MSILQRECDEIKNEDEKQKDYKVNIKPPEMSRERSYKTFKDKYSFKALQNDVDVVIDNRNQAWRHDERVNNSINEADRVEELQPMIQHDEPVSEDPRNQDNWPAFGRRQ